MPDIPATTPGNEAEGSQPKTTSGQGDHRSAALATPRGPSPGGADHVSDEERGTPEPSAAGPTGWIEPTLDKASRADAGSKTLPDDD